MRTMEDIANDLKAAYRTEQPTYALWTVRDLITWGSDWHLARIVDNGPEGVILQTGDMYGAVGLFQYNRPFATRQDAIAYCDNYLRKSFGAYGIEYARSIDGTDMHRHVKTDEFYRVENMSMSSGTGLLEYVYRKVEGKHYNTTDRMFTRGCSEFFTPGRYEVFTKKQWDDLPPSAFAKEV